jgi:hypothetical protein
LAKKNVFAQKYDEIRRLDGIPFRPFQIFSKIPGDIRESRCTIGINDTGGKSATPVAKFSTIFPSVVDTDGK